MLPLVDDLICQLLHGRWAQLVSYSRQGAWRCTKPGCAAQRRHDVRLTRPQPILQPIPIHPDHSGPRRRAA